MWDLPEPGLEPVPPALTGGFLTTVPPGKHLTLFKTSSWYITKKIRVFRGYSLEETKTLTFYIKNNFAPFSFLLAYVVHNCEILPNILYGVFSSRNKKEFIIGEIEAQRATERPRVLLNPCYLSH